MKQIIFGRWGKPLRNQLQGDSDASDRPADHLPPARVFPEHIIALMSGKGFLQFEQEFNFVPMIREYVSLIQAHFCCGKCITGIKGSKVLLLTLDRLIEGKGQDSDLDILTRMADVLNDTAKCSVCQSAGELLRDGLKYFPNHFLEAVTSGVRQQSVRYLGQISAPCMNTCPCHINIPSYVELLQELRYDQSLEVIREEMPLPSITGRVCPAPCEKACSLANMGDVAIPIKILKRVAADYELAHHLEPAIEKVEPTGAPVAVIGAGPAGLSAAYYLNRLGHPVTIHERLKICGGMVVVGIPPYRQPREVLARDIVIIQDLGVTVKEGIALGKDFSIQDLFDQGFKAIFIGIGSHLSLPLGLKGEDQGTAGVFRGGIDFLRDLNLGREVAVGNRVVIVGGGNTAIDCARACLRMGAAHVSILYRRTEHEMRAVPEEVKDAREEGIKFHFLALPVEILSRDGKMVGIRCIRMQLGEPDSSGRRRPIPVQGSDFEMEADTLIPAIGQKASLAFLFPEGGIEVSRWETVKVDPDTLMTARPGVFAAGDVVTGPLTVVHGMAGGKRAARMIHQYLTTGKCSPTSGDFIQNLISNIERDHRVLVTASTPGRTGGESPQRKLDVRERITNFLEVDSGFTQRSSFIEASRCLRCFHLVLAALREGAA